MRSECAVQDLFNYNFIGTSFADIREHVLNDILGKETTLLKLNYSLGYILHHKLTGELRFFHPCQNIGRKLQVPIVIKNRDDLKEFLDSLSDLSFRNQTKYENSEWAFVCLTNIVFFINKLRDHLIGCGKVIPDYVKNNRGLYALVTNKQTGVAYEDKLCLFRCLSLHQDKDVGNCERSTHRNFEKYCQAFSVNPSSFPGATLFDLCAVEDLFEVNLMVYELSNETGSVVARLIQRSREIYAKTVNLNLYNGHFSYIFDFSKYAHSYACLRCSKMWNDSWAYHRHVKSCTFDVRYKYPGGIYQNPKTIYEKLQEHGVSIPAHDRFYPYCSTFDYESFMDKCNLPQNTDKTTWLALHRPLFVSVCSNVPGFQTPVCFVDDTGDDEDLVLRLLQYLEKIALTAYQLLKNKFQYVFALQEHANPVLAELINTFDAFLKEHIILGFNSGKYDLNVVKPLIIKHLRPRVSFTILKNNDFMCLKTDIFKFLDIKNYIAPGFLYKKFIKAYGASQSKFCFP